MFLKKVRLVNFCQHVDRTITFGNGLNVIVGPNGCGKSNILNAIYGCLTGDFGRNAGKTVDNININKKSGETSYIELDLSHNNYDLSMTRRLEPADRRLTVGDESYTADKEVSDKLYNLLEVDKDILNQYVFVEQWDHFGPLSLAPAKRAAAFQKIFKIDQLGKISEELSDGSVKLASVNVSSYDLVALNSQLESLTAVIDEQQISLNLLTSLKDLDNKITELNNAVNDWKRKQKLTETIANRKTLMSALSDKVEAYNKELAERNAAIISISDEIEAAQESYDSATKIEAAWIKYNYYLDQKNKLTSKTADLMKESASKTEPLKPESYEESVDVIVAKLDDLKFKHQQHKQFLKSIDVANDSATCPTCGTSAKNLLAKWKQAKEESTTLADEIITLSEQVTANNLYDKQYALYSVWLKSFEKRVDETAKAVESLNVEIQPEFSREEAAQIISSYNKLNSSLTSTAKIIAKLDSDINLVNSSLAQHETELKAETEEIAKYEVITEEYINDANVQIAKIKEDKSAVTSLTTSIAVNKSELKALTEKINTAKAQMGQAELHSSWNDRIDNLKKVFKFNALPTVLSYKYMDRVVVELNNTLNDIGLPFNIKLEDDLSFTANFGSHEVPATRLSGGQKIMLTIAYRLAINFTFATNLGLLCLDEPTVGLDDANLGALEKAFERLKQFSLANGVQIVVVTHEKGISHLFDHTIDLSRV